MYDYSCHGTLSIKSELPIQELQVHVHGIHGRMKCNAQHILIQGQQHNDKFRQHRHRTFLACSYHCI